jgi:hypothetical protein
VTANLPFGFIFVLQGMSLDLPNNGGSIRYSVFECPDDSVLAFIPEGMETADHDDELDVQAAISLSELKELNSLSLQPLPWTMPNIDPSTSDHFKISMASLCEKHQAIFTEFSGFDRQQTDKEFFHIDVPADTALSVPM